MNRVAGDAISQPVREGGDGGHVVVATAGHVDHGKSTLVRALTGTDPDRLEEEKRRGLTIDLGFASCTLASGRVIAFVDVPGHARFLKNMLAGVGAVRACLFTVDLAEGWRAQSAEHLAILELLGAVDGVVALTKRSRVDRDRAGAVRDEVRERLTGSFLASAPLVEVDAVDGTGMPALRNELDELASRSPLAPDDDRPRLWIDRSFTIRGAGTVVTGTLTGGRVEEGDSLLVLPGAHPVGVRQVHVLNERRPSARPGSRVALNLTGVDAGEIGRGRAVVRTGQWHETRLIDAAVRAVAGRGTPISRRGSYLAYVGTAEVAVELRVLGGDAIAPGATGAARLRLASPLPLVLHDRFVLRETGRDETVAGGVVLDVDPMLPPSRARPDGTIERIVTERGWVDALHLERLTGTHVEPTLGRWVVAPQRLDADRGALLERLRAAGGAGLEIAALDERMRALLPTIADVALEGPRARLRSSTELDQHALLRTLRGALFDPPSIDPTSVDRDELRALLQRRLVVQHDGIYFAGEAVGHAAAVASSLLARRPEGFTLAELRDALHTSRRRALALAEMLDAAGATRRRGGVRISGTRLEAVAAGAQASGAGATLRSDRGSRAEAR